MADVNGDGFPDLLAAGADGKIHFLINETGKLREGSMALPAGGVEPLAALRPGWLENPGQMDLVAATRRGQLRVYQKQGPPARWVEVKMKRLQEQQPGHWQRGGIQSRQLLQQGGGDRQPPARVHGGMSKMDVIRVTWPNAVVQNWINVETGKQIEVRESERLASSCPLLYRWDGGKFVFVTDVLGVGPLGELAPDGTRIKPFAEDLVRLPALAARCARRLPAAIDR